MCTKELKVVRQNTYSSYCSASTIHLPTTAYPPGNILLMTSSGTLSWIPSGNHVAIASPTRRPNAAPKHGEDFNNFYL